jgi:hypothetical protein
MAKCSLGHAWNGNTLRPFSGVASSPAKPLPNGGSPMPIAAASAALARHLRTLLEGTARSDGWSVEAMTLTEARTNPGHGIALVLWRVQPDEPAGDTSPLRTASKADPPDGGGFMLRYLLVVRGKDSEDEQVMLGRCMAALDQNPVVSDARAPGNIAAGTLVVTIETPTDDAYLRLMEACGEPPPLAVPYVVHSVRLRPPTTARTSDVSGTE